MTQPPCCCAGDRQVMVNMLYLFGRFYQQSYTKKKGVRKEE